MTRRTFAWAGPLAVAAVAVAAAPGQDPPAADKTKAVAPIPSTFRSYVVFDPRFLKRQGVPGTAPPPGTDTGNKAAFKLARKEDARSREDRLHDFVTENGLSPVIAVFARTVPDAADSPLGNLLRAVDRAGKDYRSQRLGTFCVFLRTEAGEKKFTLKQADGTTAEVTADKEYPDDDRTTGTGNAIVFVRETEKAAVEDFATKVVAAVLADAPAAEKRPADVLDVPRLPYGLASTKSKMTELFGLGDADDVTVIVYSRLSVAQRWAFAADKPPTADDVKAIRTAVDDAVKALRQ